VQCQSKHIFYTDDDEDDQELFRGALTEVDAELELITTDDGDTLLELLACPPPVPRIIFLDLNMPRRDGFDILQKIREDQSCDTYPVVVFSTSSDASSVDRTREMGANLFVAKPRTYNGMKQAILTCVNMDWAVLAETKHDYLMRFN
jgi:response regulator RpfG family c-di-GMP phosphodiesterase